MKRKENLQKGRKQEEKWGMEEEKRKIKIKGKWNDRGK